MAGALTANTIDARVRETVATDESTILADVANLSPVDGAANALLTGIVLLTELDEVDELSFQWYRCALGSDVADDVLGVAVGDPFVIDAGDSELVVGPVVIQAIDRAALSATAYALEVIGDPGNIVIATALYADAVLYD